jgi:beta-glucosidase-like glycosyl hydrolase
MAKSKRAAIHYVNNREFSQAVVDYCEDVSAAKSAGNEIPIVPNYIAECFLRIAEGLSHKSNFIRYTYREEMVMDAVENCLKAIENYNVEAATRTGNPNAFAYFTQISWFAFLRRIAKEKKQQDVKLKYLSQSGLEDFIVSNTSDAASVQAVQAFVDTLKDRIDKVKEKDDKFKVYAKEEKRRKKRDILVDSDLGDFLKDD